MFKIRRNLDSPDFQQSSRWALIGVGLYLLASATGDVMLESQGLISPFSLTLSALGILCFIYSVFKLARSKNRSPFWGSLGVLALVGWILVAFLEDRSPES